MKRNRAHQSPSSLTRYVEDQMIALRAGRCDDKSNGKTHTDTKIIVSDTGHNLNTGENNRIT
jgi:hypothetical protein